MPSTYLMLLVTMGQKEAVKDAVKEKKCDVNEFDDAGARPVHVAADINNLDILKILVDDGGAELDVADAFKQTPLSLAEDNKNQDMINYIKDSIESAKTKGKGLSK